MTPFSIDFSSISLLLVCFIQLGTLGIALQSSLMDGMQDLKEQEALRIMSYNVRFDSQPDSISVHDSIQNLTSGLPPTPVYYANSTEQPWSLRRLYIANDILFNHVDLFGGQELLKRQIDDLAILLGHEFKWIGVGRDDGREEGEYSAIFYRTSSVALESWDTFWLSDTPFEPSKFPNAGSRRLCTTAHFQKTSNPETSFTMLNTHLDDQSADQRALGLSLVLHRAKYEAIKSQRPVILTGDFNSPPSDDAYQIITGARDPRPINQTFLKKYSWKKTDNVWFDNFAMQDMLETVEPRHRIGGNFATFTDFRPVGNTTEFSRLDYIMGSSSGGWKALTYRVGDNIGDDGVYHSDHRPVIADILL